MARDRCGAREGRGGHGRRTAGGLRTNPRYFTVASGDGRRAVYLTGSHIWNNFHDGMGPGADVRRAAGAVRLRRLPRLPRGARSQLHPALALGAVPVPGRGRRLPPLHDAAAVGAHRAGRGDGRQAEVRPRPVRPRVLRPAARPRRRRRRARHLRRGDVLRRMGAPPQPGARPRRGPSVPRGQQRQRDRDRVDPRLSGPAARPPASRSSRRRTSARSSTPSTTCRTCSGRSRTSPPAAAASTPSSPRCSGSRAHPSGATRPQWQYWVIDVVRRHEQRAGIRPASDRDDDAVPRARSRRRSTIRCSPAGPSGSRPATTTRSSRAAATRWRPDLRSRAGWRTRRPRDGRKVVITDTDHYAPGRGDALWAWKSFLRGHHPILMDFGLIGGVNPPDPSPGARLGLRAGPVRDGRHAALRRADGPHRHAAARRPQLDRLRAGEPRARSTSCSQPSRGGPVHGDARAGHLRRRVVRRRRPHDVARGVRRRWSARRPPASTRPPQASGPSVLYLRAT